MQIVGIQRALPKHYASQEALTAALAALWSNKPHNPARLQSMHQNMAIGGRYTALPLQEYAALDTFTASNDAFIEQGTNLAEAALRASLEQAGLQPQDIDHLFFVSVTGIATPSLDARLMNRLRLKPSVKRTPIFGLGCMAGAAGLARLADSLRAFPDETGVLVSVELCSLTLQRGDMSVTNFVASGLFGDAAVAVAMVGERHPAAKLAAAPARELGGEGQATGQGGAVVHKPGAAVSQMPRVVASESVFYPDSEDLMGWRIGSDGFKIVLSAQVPDIVRAHVQGDVDAFLRRQHLTRANIATYVLHPGGPKIIDAMQEALELGDSDVLLGRENLAKVGNVSSAAVLLMLEDLQRRPQPPRGSYGLLMAMGPGFCAEMVLLQWN